MEQIEPEIETTEPDIIIQPKRHNYAYSYCLKKNDTTIITVSANNFRPVIQQPYCQAPAIDTLHVINEDYYQCVDLVNAMEKAKAGALLYIKGLIDMGPAGNEALLQYRIDHYEDLHINLVDANIQLVEQKTINDRNFKWTPYRIKN